MRFLRAVPALIGAGIIAATAFVATPAMALDPVTYAIDCTIEESLTESIPIYEGQDAVFTFSPATCSRAYWSGLNPALPNQNPLSGTATKTIAAADIICGNSFDIYDDAFAESYQLTFTGCGTAPEPEPETPAAAPLPDTGIDATALGLASAGLLAAGVATIVVVRRRNA